VADEDLTPAEEKARVRRRLLTLGEVLAVAAVAISGLTFWNSYSERTSGEAERMDAARKAAEADRKTSQRARTLVLRATPNRDADRLDLAPLQAGQAIQSQTVAFPSALGVNPVETTGDSRIEADWFGSELRKARRSAGIDDDAPGDHKLPVLVSTRLLGDDTLTTDVAIYDVGYALEGRLLGGHDVRLRGLSLVERGGDGKRLDALWARRTAKK